MTSFTPVSTSHGATPAGLTETSSPHEIVRYLREEAQLTNHEIATAIGTVELTISRWARDPNARPRDRAAAEHLDDLRDLALLLADTLPGEHTGRWIRARSRLLGGERPKDLITTDYQRVRIAAEQFISGDPT